MNIYKFRGKLSRVVGLALLAMVFLFGSYWEDTVLGEMLFIVGVVLISFATIGRVWCTFFIAGHKTKILVTEGPYSMCQNPLYFCSFVGAIGVGLLTETFTMPLLVAAFFALYYPGIIKMEQKRLYAVHGHSLDDYQKKTPVFWPSLANYNEPKEYLADPVIFRKHLMDAVIFIMMIAIAEGAELLNLHDAIGIFPTLY